MKFSSQDDKRNNKCLYIFFHLTCGLFDGLKFRKIEKSKDIVKSIMITAKMIGRLELRDNDKLSQERMIFMSFLIKYSRKTSSKPNQF